MHHHHYDTDHSGCDVESAHQHDHRYNGPSRDNHDHDGHHHSDDGSTLYHEHSHGDNGPHNHSFYSDFTATIRYGPADHNHDKPAEHVHDWQPNPSTYKADLWCHLCGAYTDNVVTIDCSDLAPTIVKTHTSPAS